MPKYDGEYYKSVSRMFAMQVWGTWEAIPPEDKERILKSEEEQTTIVNRMPEVDMRPLKRRRFLN